MRRGGPSSSWMKRELRLAIYYRDGYRCMYCGQGVEAGAVLTLDHVVPRYRGGDGSPENVVTACVSCNSAKQDLRMSSWLRLMRENGHDTHGLRRRIAVQLSKPLIIGAPAHMFYRPPGEK